MGSDQQSPSRALGSRSWHGSWVSPSLPVCCPRCSGTHHFLEADEHLRQRTRLLQCLRPLPRGSEWAERGPGSCGWPHVLEQPQEIPGRSFSNPLWCIKKKKPLGSHFSRHRVHSFGEPGRAWTHSDLPPQLLCFLYPDFFPLNCLSLLILLTCDFSSGSISLCSTLSSI